MAAGSALILASGWAWYTVITNTPPNVSFSLAVLRFIPGDIVKIALAAAVLPTGWALLKRKASGD